MPSSPARSIAPAPRSLWERLWPALAAPATAVGLFLAVSWLGLWLWLPPVGRAIGLCLFFLLAAAASVPLLRLRLPTREDALRRLDRRSGLPHRPATTIADDIAVSTTDPLLAGALARPYRARLAVRHPAQGRSAVAAPGGARSLCAARAGPGAGDRHLRGRRRRAPAAHLGGLRLAGRDRAGQFPRRCLGEPADLYGQAAGDPAGHAARRADADRIQSGRTGLVGAGRQHAGHPRHRRCSSRRRGDRRPRRSEGRGTGRCQGRPADQSREGHRGAPLHHQRCGQCHRPGRRPQRGDLAIHRHTGPAADHRAHQGSGGAGARQPAALLQARGRLRRGRRAGELQAQGRRRRRPIAAALAVRGARVPACRCRRRAPATGSARPPRI